MKRFAFPLRRVLDWRKTQANLEEMKLARLHGELRDIENQIAHARAEQADSERELLESSTVTGERLTAYDSFRKSVAAECARLEMLAAASRRKIEHQREMVVARRRDALLLEKVEQQRLESWTAEFNREIDRDADEAHTSRRSGLRNHRRTAMRPSASAKI